jgi:antitoxin (DNA-binding transcriptional repressor) of toxin-antitoxin stability system
MRTITLAEFNAKCVDLLKEIHKTRQPIVITLRRKPIARVEPVAPPKEQVRLGALKGWMEIRGDIIKSDFDQDFLVQ